ncbi:MAG: hypothetical protein CVU80_02745, partial [Elusimicrobia bacterium HGW-Elusimicrobia-4]
TFVTAAIPSYGYYLIANAGTVYIGGTRVSADATYSGDIITDDAAGGLALTDNFSVWIDSVGWRKTGLGTQAPSNCRETTGVEIDGLQSGYQIYRWHYTDSDYGETAGSICGGGPFDSNDNSIDYSGLSAVYLPYNSASTYTPLCGTPAYGAVVSANDGLSSPTTAYQKLSAGGKYNAYFSIAVTTGTVTVYVSSRSYYREIANVSVTADVGTAIPNSSTSPQWPASGRNEVILSSPSFGGFISGKVVQEGTSTGLSGIKVGAGGYTTTTDSNGNYNFSVEAGSYTVTANPDYFSASWTEDSETVEVNENTSQTLDNLEIAPAGWISGKTKNASNDALSYITICATVPAKEFSKDTVSGTDGTYSLKGIKTGDCNVYPILDEADSYTPAGGYSFTLSQGEQKSDQNFTITSSWGKVKGTVFDTAIGGNITTGVLIVATTAAMPAESPDTINSSFRSGTKIYYGTVSLSDGTYEIFVRKGYAYNMRAWYTKQSDNT